jgi:aconitate hydratase
VQAESSGKHPDSDIILRFFHCHAALKGVEMQQDVFNSQSILKVGGRQFSIHRLSALEGHTKAGLKKLPYSIRIMLEAALRQCNGKEITREDIENIASWSPQPSLDGRPGIPFLPSRVIMQDLTGIPAVVDLAAMRSAMARLGGSPNLINPLVPVDLVIDHSIQVDFFANADALQRNTEMEFQRNRERYEFLKWGQKAFSNFRVVPPMTGIVHQINLEYLASVVRISRVEGGDESVAYPDTVIGTDSHTTMINALGVLGWGVGGIEAEAVMLGQPMDMLLPDVIGFKLHGNLKEGITATDLVLTVTQILRRKGVVDKFVEFFGPGLSNLSLPDRAVISNMSPEYGATMGFFPVDAETLNYLRLTGRPVEQTELVEAYCREQGLFHEENTAEPEYTEMLELNLDTVVPSLAGPKRPQDRVALNEMKSTFRSALTAPVNERGYALKPEDVQKRTLLGTNGGSYEIGHGAVVIAAITSCTNTSNPSVMVAAGLLAKKAVEKGLKTPPQVKTSLAPGSRVVTEYLKKTNLLDPLAALGFIVVAYGCTTCIGNSGPLPGEVARAVSGSDLVAAAVISGNRNFEGRVHPLVKANYLASPPLVVAYALAGTVDIDLTREPLGMGSEGPVFLKDIWPTTKEVAEVVAAGVDKKMFEEKYASVFEGSRMWKDIKVSNSELFPWSETSTYIHHPPFFQELGLDVPPIKPIKDARVLIKLGDSITTDHISPAGNIAPDSPAGMFLLEKDVLPRDFNSYGARRGNDLVMLRGTFANIRLHNRLVPGVEGYWTRYFGPGEIYETTGDNEPVTIFEAAMGYKEAGIPTIILAGREYGTGSSRDWAAKGTLLLGVRAVIAESFERIHRSNLVGMGVLPLRFMDGQSADSLGLTGEEVFEIEGLDENIQPKSILAVTAKKSQTGKSKGEAGTIKFKVQVLMNTPVEVNYHRNGGILQTVLRNLVAR